MAALIGVASQVVGEVNGLYSASLGADGLDFLSASLGASGSYGGESVSFVRQDTAETGISKVDVMATDGSSEVLFSFYYATITNAVSDGGDGSVEFQAFSSLADAGGSPFFTLTVNPDSTYAFDINHITYDQTITVEDLALNFNLSVTNADGDTVALADGLTITMLDPDIAVSADADGVDANNGRVVGSGEADTLIGGEGDDILIGGGSGYLLSSGAGADVFKWVAGNTGTDTVTDFVIHHNSGGDQLDLSELLVGASGSADNIGNLLSYIDISVSGSDTLVKVSSTAVADPAVAPEQTIVLDNVDLYASYGTGDASELVLSMLGDGTLKIYIA